MTGDKIVFFPSLPLPNDIQLYNTLSRALQPLRPAQAGQPLRMYTCGLTVYDYGHIGNYRTFIAVDILQRFLESENYQLEAVLNLTDIDDKMIERAQRAGRSVREHAEIFTGAFQEDMAFLGLRPPEHLVRATDYIAEMIAWIERLVEGGHAYASQGSVYFRVASFADYGKLSGKPLNELQAGARVDSDQYEKEAARDFVLWKAHKPGEPAWPSPWGPGRPGWHIECSVMSMKLLGESFDLHAGGADLIFPHHENEIAQSEALTGETFVRHWFHVEFLLVNGEKMSKSLGNYYTLRDLAAQGFHASGIRYLLASVPYRRQLNFTLEGLRQAQSAVERLRAFRDRIERSSLAEGSEVELQAAVEAAEQRFRSSLADNLNTAGALAAIFDLLRAGNLALDQERMRSQDGLAIQRLLARFELIFGVLDCNDQQRLEVYGSEVNLRVAQQATLSEQEIERLLGERAEARVQRNFQLADQLRKQLEEAGIVVEDTREGQVRWRRK